MALTVLPSLKEFKTARAKKTRPNMTGRPGYRTMEMNGGSSAPCLAYTPCVPLFCTLFHRLGSVFGRTDFSRIFIFHPPDFVADLVAGFFLLIFVGKSAQKNPPGKSPAKSSKFYTTKIPDNFLQRDQANIGVETEGLLDYQGQAGIISIVRWNLRLVIFGVEKRRRPGQDWEKKWDAPEGGWPADKNDKMAEMPEA